MSRKRRARRSSGESYRRDSNRRARLPRADRRFSSRLENANILEDRSSIARRDFRKGVWGEPPWRPTASILRHRVQSSLRSVIAPPVSIAKPVFRRPVRVAIPIRIPTRVKFCTRRKERREVLFALDRAGYRGSGPGRSRHPDEPRYRRTEESNYTC